jgi:Fe-S cluster biogenesis protein NfuA
MDKNREQKQRGKEMRALRTYIVIAILDQEGDTLALQGFSASTGIVDKSLFGNCDVFQE